MSPPLIILKVALEAIISSMPERRYAKEIVRDTSSATRKIRGDELCRPDTSNMEQMEEGARKDMAKGYYTRIIHKDIIRNIG